MDWGVGAGIAQTLLPTVQRLSKDWSDKRDAREINARNMELEQLQHISQGPNPELRDMANAAILKRTEEMQPGFKGKPAKNLLQAIHSGKFKEDPAFQHYIAIAAAHDAGMKQGAQGGGESSITPSPGLAKQFNENPAFGVAKGPPSVPPPAGIAAPQPGGQGFGDNAPGAAPMPSQPAAQIEGTGNIQPSAPMMSAASAPAPDPTIQSEMQGLGFRPDSRGGYGRTGDAMIPQVLSRMTSKKDETLMRAKAKLAQDREDSRVQAAKTKREGDLERLDIRNKAQMERLDKSIAASKSKRGSGGARQGINYDKERLEAQNDYDRYNTALDQHAEAEQAQLDLAAVKGDWDPGTVATANAKLQKSIEARRTALEKRHDKLMETLRGGGGGGAAGPPGGGPPVVPKAGSSASNKIVQKNSTTGAFRHSLDGGKTWQPGK